MIVNKNNPTATRNGIPQFSVISMLLTCEVNDLFSMNYKKYKRNKKG
jgi:hypothetical protein